MESEMWTPWSRLVFPEPGIWEYILLVLYALLTLMLLIRFRKDFTQLTRHRLLLLVGLLVAPLLVNQLLVLDFPPPDLPPPPNVPVEPSHPSVPLLGALPILAAGAYLGAGPALLVGLVSGVLRVETTTAGITQPFHLAFFGFLIGFLLHQDYRGRLPLIARQPLFAALVVTPFAKLLLLLSVFAHVADLGLSGFDYAVTLMKAHLGPALVESLAAAIVVQTLYLFFPRLRPVRVARRSPPYSRSLSRRLLFLLIPLILIVTSVLVCAVTATTLRMTTLEVVNEMARDAISAAEGIPHFIHTGQGLLTAFANDEQLWHSDPHTLEGRLSNDLRTIVFFSQLMLFGPDGQLLAMYPPAPMADSELTPEEKMLLQRVLEHGAPQISSAHRSHRGEPILSFLVPVEPTRNGENSPRFRALLGRTYLDVNPVLNRILTGLQWTNGQGEGFIVDSEGRIISHSDFSRILAEWQVDQNRPRVARVPRGWAYESHDPIHNTRQLIYYLPAEGYPWAIVICLPYEAVLERAQEVATPLLLLQILLGGGLVVATPLITTFLIRPLKQLAAAADRIAEGDLRQPVHVTSEDEVGRVGDAFEDMRVRLKHRVEGLSLLLAVSQAVSATLELSRGIPIILEGALKATKAQVARVMLLSASGEPQVVMSKGQLDEGLEALDRALAAAVKSRERPVIVENLAHARTLVNPEILSGPIKAVIVLPIRTKDQMSAVMWVGYKEARHFDDLEVNLLSMLTGQTAVLVENARLFQVAEGGRRRLTAILDSTTDAVLVTDQEERILLVNPAAERAFDIAAKVVLGQKIERTELAPVLVQALTGPSSPDEALIEELPLPDGRTLYVNVSTILDADGEQIGRVAVMRDVTHFKELDEMKSECLATVSHDLRAPLTFIRGYATMLSTMDELTDKQREHVKMILHGIEQIDELVRDLLDLRRIEAGVGLERKPCDLRGVLIEAVGSMRARAAAKGITLRMEPVENATIVAGDAALLRRAVANLVDNGVKYTPSGGIVTVGLSVRADGKEKRAVIRVADTGIGIAPEDQVRLFERLYRVKRRDTPPDVSGTGLGLAIVKSIVERHEGKVWLESELHKGSTFYISLPLIRDESFEREVS